MPRWCRAASGAPGPPGRPWSSVTSRYPLRNPGRASSVLAARAYRSRPRNSVTSASRAACISSCAPRRAISSKISGSGRSAANSSSMWWWIRSAGDTRTGTGVGPSFEDLPVLKGTYARRSFTPDLGRDRGAESQVSYDESARYRDFMGWDMPWYSAQPSLDALLAGRQVGLFHLVCYLREGDRVFETYWTTRRGVEAMDYSYALMDLTVYGRQEPWEDSPPGWPQQCSNTRTDGGPPTWPPVPAWPGGRPIAQWPRLEAGRSDDL